MTKEISAKKIRQSAPLLAFFCLLITGCSEPLPDFSADQSNYDAGDTIHLTNASVGAERYQWLVNAEEVSTEKDLSYLLPETAGGVYTITLQMFSGDKAYQSVKTISVTPLTGTVSAWGSFAGVQVMQVSGDEAKELGVTRAGFEQDPGCGSQGCVSVALLPGTYTVDGLSEITRTRRTVEVRRNECVSVKMH